MRIRIVVGILASFGIAVTLGSPTAEAVRTLSEVGPSFYIAVGLIPAMLAGQLMTLRKRGRR